MAIAMALNGGLGLIHYNMPERQQLSEVSRVKYHVPGMIPDPIKVTPDQYVGGRRQNDGGAPLRVQHLPGGGGRRTAGGAVARARGQAALRAAQGGRGDDAPRPGAHHQPQGTRPRPHCACGQVFHRASRHPQAPGGGRRGQAARPLHDERRGTDRAGTQIAVQAGPGQPVPAGVRRGGQRRAQRLRRARPRTDPQPRVGTGRTRRGRGGRVHGPRPQQGRGRHGAPVAGCVPQTAHHCRQRHHRGGRGISGLLRRQHHQGGPGTGVHLHHPAGGRRGHPAVDRPVRLQPRRRPMQA
ncbi:MAG: hypothetical protein KatS3mg132_349 [Limisphaera sp.]|nr:MAG: hypothetical protein KatS3mg132_349 [Limisphaera sp.]